MANGNELQKDAEDRFWEWVEEKSGYSPEQVAVLREAPESEQSKAAWNYFINELYQPSTVPLLIKFSYSEDQWQDAEDQFWAFAEKNYNPSQVTALRGGQIGEIGDVLNYFQDIVYREPGAVVSESKRTLDAMWNWAETKYSKGEIRTIAGNTGTLNKVLQHYTENIQGTQWDVGYEEPSLGRPQADKYGITDWDFQSLKKMSLPQAEADIGRMLDAGTINEYQARDIYAELTGFREEAGMRAYILKSQEQSKIRQAEETAAEKQRRTEALQRGVAVTGVGVTGREPAQLRQPQDYTPAFEGLRAGIDVPQTESWRYWFERQYPRLIAQYEAQYPVGEEAKPSDITWADWLKKKKPELKEERAKLSPYERGERPGVYQPRIQTVQF